MASPAASLDGLELAAGVPLGVDAGVGGLPVGGGVSARVALEDEVVRALRRPPCVVSFSGGSRFVGDVGVGGGVGAAGGVA